MLKNVTKGDIVARKSYNKDVIFMVDKIIDGKVAILTGITTRLKADSYIDDLEIVDKREIQNLFNEIDKKIVNRVKNTEIEKNSVFKRSNKIIYTGRILHLDGDKRYSEKSNVYYKKMGLKAIVRNITESNQANVVNSLIDRYKPDILVITGHDGMIRKGRNYEDLLNYRNSKYFAQTVKNARKNLKNRDLVIFAGACQSYYEALIDAGANFASSPARILIDFVDPLVVATKVATTDSNKYITITDIEDELRDGERGINRNWGCREKENFVNLNIDIFKLLCYYYMGSELIVETDENKIQQPNIKEKGKIRTEEDNNFCAEVKLEEKNQIKVDENPKVTKRKETIKKVSNVILIFLFNIVVPYVIYIVSNISNAGFFPLREVRRSTGIYNFSFLYEIVMIYGVYFLFKAIFRKSFRANVAFAVLFNIISIISYYKIGVVAKPFWPEDILLVGNALEIARYGNLHIEPVILIQVFLTILILLGQWVVTLYTKYEGKMKIVTRVVMGIVSAIVVGGITLFNWTGRQGFDENNYNYQINYSIYGASVEFFRNAYKLVEKPSLEIYSVERLEKIKAENENIGNENGKGEESPNIIVIMSESFSDITQVDLLDFKKDPLPTYRSLLEDYPHGNTVVSIFGGETSMSEFEFLTGTSTRFLNGKRYPYEQIVKDNTTSIVKTLKEQGYYTTAIHAHGGEFYNRINAYKYFGFDKMVFEDEMEDIDNVYDESISDMDTAEEIVKQYEEAGDAKKFIFTITMELHSPYNASRYPEYDLGVTLNVKTTPLEASQIVVYSQGLSNFDKSLKYLIDYFEQKEEKVMLVVYGDHLPAFNGLYDAEYGDGIGRYETPYIMWTNYEMDQGDIEKYSKDKISIAGLSMMVLDEANIELPWYYNFIYEFYKKYPVCTNKFLLDQDGNELSTDTNNELIEDYNIIAFDMLYAKNLI